MEIVDSTFGVIFSGCDSPPLNSDVRLEQAEIGAAIVVTLDGDVASDMYCLCAIGLSGFRISSRFDKSWSVFLSKELVLDPYGEFDKDKICCC